MISKSPHTTAKSWNDKFSLNGYSLIVAIVMSFLSGAIISYAVSMAMCRSQLDALNNRLDEANSRIAQLEKTIKSLKRDLATKDKTIEILRTRLNPSNQMRGIGKQDTKSNVVAASVVPLHPDVGKVVTNAFAQVMVVDAVVTPRGPRRNGVEIRDRRLFASNAENELDGILSTELGDVLFGSFDKERFESEFIAALNNKIEFDSEDTEDERDRKQQMIDVKNMLKEAMQNGESIGEIVEAWRNEVNRIGIKRGDLLGTLSEMKASGLSYDEIEDAYEAANIILREEGAKEVLSPGEIRARLEDYRQRRRR